MVTMDTGKILLLTLLALELRFTSGFFCNPSEIKSCLAPSLNFLKNQTAGHNKTSHVDAGLLQTAIQNYFSILDKSSESVFHSDSVKAVLVKLDVVFSDPELLKNACSVFKQTEKCLILKEDWCDGEVRDDLQGIENVFNIMCHQNYMDDFKANHACLNNTALETTRESCDTNLAQTLADMGNILERTTRKERTAGIGSDYSAYTGTLEESEPCKSVHGAVNCYITEVKTVCGEELAKWEKRLRHSLVQFLLMDLNCQADQGDFDYFEPLADESQYFVCASKEDYIALDKRCDGQPDCRDTSDETDCSTSKAWTLLDILLITIGLTAALVILIMCAVKWREDIAFTFMYHLHRSSPREMQTFVTEEEEIGESTPPPMSKPFQYDQLSPSHTSNVTNSILE